MHAMNTAAPPNTAAPRRSYCNELVLSDRLINLAQDADSAGYIDTAGNAADPGLQRVRRGTAQEPALMAPRMRRMVDGGWWARQGLNL